MSKAQDLTAFYQKRTANPPATPAAKTLSDAEEALLKFEVKQEESAAKNNPTFSIFVTPADDTSPQGILGPVGMERAQLTSDVRNANLAVLAESQFAVPKWDSLLSQAEQALQVQQTKQAVLTAQTAARNTTTVAVVAAGVLGVLVILELL